MLDIRAKNDYCREILKILPNKFLETKMYGKVNHSQKKLYKYFMING